MIPRVLYYSPVVDSVAGSSASPDTDFGAEIAPGAKPKGNDRVPVRNLAKANLISSYVKDSPGLHAPVLDIDTGTPSGAMSAVRDWYFAEFHRTLGLDAFAVVPSTTAGHFHLYVNIAVSWECYEHLLDRLVDLKILESGYAGASKARGATYVRKPGHGKPVMA